MKKSELMGYLVYAILFAVAIVVGLLVVRPIMGEFADHAPINYIAFLVIAIVLGIVLNALLIEIGHLIGAKIGHYKVYSWTCLWLGFREKDGKRRFAVQNYDGFLGETKITPKSEKSNPKAYIYMPLALFLLEVVAGVVLIVISDSNAGPGEPPAHPTWLWWKLLGIIVLTCGGIVYIYDIFPAALDSKNDGYLLTVLTNKTNIEAYNDLLLAEYKLATGQKIEEAKVYDKVTNFTSRINAIATAKAIDEGRYEEAISIVDKTIASKNDVSSYIYEDAVAQRVSLLILSGNFEEGKKEYIASSLEVKKHIASMGTPAAVRAYILVSGLIDESKSELENALGRVDAVIKKGEEKTRESESKLIKTAIKMVLEKQKDWDFSSYNLNLGDKKEEAPDTEKKEEAKTPEKESEEEKGE